MLTVVGQIEKVAANRTQIIQAARRAYDEKGESSEYSPNPPNPLTS